MDTRNSPVFVVLGPTGSGKSHLALSLARHFEGEVVNFDSVQLYRDLRVGAAKLPEEHRAGIPHHLLDVLALHEEMTAGAFARLARPLLGEIAGRVKIPILTGGTGFYLRAILDGLSPAPPRNAELRRRLATVAERRPHALHRLLRRCDPPAAGRIHPNDHQKLMRALELTRHATPPRDALTGFRVLKLGLSPERKLLAARLDDRSKRMFEEDGLLAETAGLLAGESAPAAKPLAALGYKQAVAHLAGKMSLAEAIRECQTRTRQYAKRQITWFRSEPGVFWLQGFGTEAAIQAEAIAEATRFLNEEREV